MADKPSIHTALNAVKKAVGAVGKNETNQMQKFNFRGIDSVVNACAPHLNEQGIIVTPKVTEYVYETVTVGAKQTPMGHVTLVATYTFHGPAGDSIDSTVIAEAMDSGDKACAKAMSVAYRIALLQTLNLPTDEPDPDSTSYERSGDVVSKASSAVRRDDLVTVIQGASTVAELRKIWKEAGAAGILKNEVINSDGEKVTLTDLLYARSDELSFQSGVENAGSAAA